MKPALEDGLLRLGCLASIVGAALLVPMAFYVNWIYAAGTIGVIVIWVVLSRLKVLADERRLRSALSRAFSSAQHLAPQMMIERSHGFIRIMLEFSSSENRADAERLGCMQSFKTYAQSLFGHWGTKTNRFDVNRAVYAYVVGK